FSFSVAGPAFFTARLTWATVILRAAAALPGSAVATAVTAPGPGRSRTSVITPSDRDARSRSTSNTLLGTIGRGVSTSGGVGGAGGTYSRACRGRARTHGRH